MHSVMSVTESRFSKPLPAALDRRGHRRCLRREGQRRPKARLFLLRGRAGPAFIGQATHQGRGAADCSERRQAAGVIGKTITHIGAIILATCRQNPSFCQKRANKYRSRYTIVTLKVVCCNLRQQLSSPAMPLIVAMEERTCGSLYMEF